MWKNTGEVELIPELFSNGKTSQAVRKSSAKTQNDDEDFFSPHRKQVLLNEDEMILNNMTPLQANSVPTTALLQIKVQVKYINISMYTQVLI